MVLVTYACFYNCLLYAASDNLIESPQSFWNIQLDNDSFSSKKSDLYYTGGLQVTRLTKNNAIRWQQDLLEWASGDKGFVDSSVEYSIGQKIFNPADTSLLQASPDDRPYAGWLYGLAATSFLLEQTPRMDTYQFIEFSLGIVGPSSMAEEVQEWIHDILKVDHHLGWGSQLRDEPGIGLATIRKWILKLNSESGLQKDVSPHLVMSLGNVYTYVGAGVMLRIGQNLGADIGPPGIRPGLQGSAAFSHLKQSTAWYFFLAHESRLVLRNIFLDGNSFRDSPGVEKEIYVRDYQLGLACRYNGIRLAFSNVYRSREFEGQHESMQYGAISISYFL